MNRKLTIATVLGALMFCAAPRIINKVDIVEAYHKVQCALVGVNCKTSNSEPWIKPK